MFPSQVQDWQESLEVYARIRQESRPHPRKDVDEVEEKNESRAFTTWSMKCTPILAINVYVVMEQTLFSHKGCYVQSTEFGVIFICGLHESFPQIYLGFPLIYLR